MSWLFWWISNHCVILEKILETTNVFLLKYWIFVYFNFHYFHLEKYKLYCLFPIFWFFSLYSSNNYWYTKWKLCKLFKESIFFMLDLWWSKFKRKFPIISIWSFKKLHYINYKHSLLDIKFHQLKYLWTSCVIIVLKYQLINNLTNI